MSIGKGSLSAPAWILVSGPFTLTFLIVLFGTYNKYGSVENFWHVANFSATLFIALLVSFGALMEWGKPAQKKIAQKIFAALLILAGIASIIFMIWFHDGFTF